MQIKSTLYIQHLQLVVSNYPYEKREKQQVYCAVQQSGCCFFYANCFLLLFLMKGNMADFALRS